jgi:serine/threonine protein kinase
MVIRMYYLSNSCWYVSCTVDSQFIFDVFEKCFSEGVPPFQGPSDFLVHLRSKKVDLDFPPDFDLLAEDLIHSCLVIEPERRLGSYDMPPLSMSCN